MLNLNITMSQTFCYSKSNAESLRVESVPKLVEELEQGEDLDWLCQQEQVLFGRSTAGGHQEEDVGVTQH